ncbi:MAG: leucyl aminopeptidase family protein [Rhodobacteraceae bacterium]|nr:leucyl aminopeptidase family protein [Paracoccaceae bacterium]
MPAFAPDDAQALPLHVVAADAAADWVAAQAPAHRAWLTAQGFSGKLGLLAVLPGTDGRPEAAAFGWGDAAARARGRFHLAKAAEGLPEGAWRIEGAMAPDEAEEAALGWLLSAYRFDRYRRQSAPNARLVAPAGVDARRLEAIAAAEVLTRDLINTPAADMGPEELEAAAFALAAGFGAAATAVRGDDLLAQGFPMIHAVGRASARAPRLIELTWGNAGPRLTLVGKGVCFDTGGLDLKPAASMGMVMALGLKVRLRVLIPAVENAVSGTAFRPQDILTSRKGLTVEVNNTDAEGRLVLADALAYACEGEAPDCLISMATLTGAARVALGPDLPPFFTDDDRLAAVIAAGAARARDPVWRMPFWVPYEDLIEPGIADLDNAPAGGMAGAITAALFLRRFVAEGVPYAHFDIYGWQPKAAPGRQKGGAGQGARALLAGLPGYLGL